MNTDLRERLVTRATDAARDHPAQLKRSLAEGGRRLWRRIILVNTITVLTVAVLAAFLGAAAALRSEDGSGSADLLAVTVTPGEATVRPGQSLQLVASGANEDGSSQVITGTVDWSSTDPGIASVGGGGLATGIAPGEVIITATDGDVVGTATLTVTRRSVRLTAITVTPSEATIIAGGSRQFAVTGAYNDGSSREITATLTWRSDRPAVATVDESGLATGHSAGTATITARTENVQATASLTVTKKGVTLTAITVDPPQATVPAGESLTFSAIGAYSDGSSQDVTDTVDWRTDDPYVAAVDGSGLVATVDPGSTSVIASIDGIEGTSVLTVTKPSPALRGITVSPAELTDHCPNKTAQLSATGTYTDGTKRDLTNEVSWSSDEPAVASVDQAGVVTGQGDGSATITASQGSKSATAAVSCVIVE